MYPEELLVYLDIRVMAADVALLMYRASSIVT